MGRPFPVQFFYFDIYLYNCQVPFSQKLKEKTHINFHAVVQSTVPSLLYKIIKVNGFAKISNSYLWTRPLKDN